MSRPAGAGAPDALEALARRVRALGASTGASVSGPSEQLFKPLHTEADDAAEQVERDLRYGPHERHRLDIHRAAAPAASAEASPVLLFVHGGGFVKGDKAAPGSFFYGNVARWAVRHGLVAANMTYRLAPEFGWPSGGDDVGLAMRWLHANIARFGGDPERIVVLGHSAGAAHAASWLTRAEARGESLEGLSGCMLLSGNYDQTAGTPRAEYYGTDPAAFAERSTVAGLLRTQVPLLIGIAEHDPPEIERQAMRLMSAFSESGVKLPRLVQAHGHNHYTITHHLGTADERLGQALLEFVASHASAPADQLHDRSQPA